MPDTHALVDLLSQAIGGDFRAFVLAWARALPVLVVVPAFGLGAVALPIRVALAAALAVGVAPAAHAVSSDSTPLLVALARELGRGLPLALAASVVVWIALMVGGLADNLRGGRETTELTLFDEPLPGVSVLLGLLAAIAFLESGGAQRVALALADPVAQVGFAAAAERLSRAIALAVAIAAPLLAGSALVEIAGAFVARAAAPAYVLPLLAPLRSLIVLLLGMLALDRIVELLALLAVSSP